MRMTDSGTDTKAGTEETAATEDAPAQPVLPAVPYGEWPSPITATDIARGQAVGSFPIAIGGDTWWQQSLPDEGGRVTIMHSSGGRQNMLLPAPWSARTRVHEYGGLSYLPVPRAARHSGQAQARAAKGYEILFANFGDQRLYLAGPGTADGREEPRPITPDPATVSGGSGTLAADRKSVV